MPDGYDDTWNQNVERMESKTERLKVGLFVPCRVDGFQPEVAWSAVHILREAGVDIDYPLEQLCCGREFYQLGYKADARQQAERFVHTFSDYDYVVSCGSACVNYLRQRLPELCADMPCAAQAVRLAGRVYELCEFLCRTLSYRPRLLRYNHTVAFFSHCTSPRGAEYGAVADFLSQVEGLRLVPMQAVCCGGGSHFSSHFAELSAAMARDRLAEAVRLGADCIVGVETECLMHLRAHAEQMQSAVRVLHVMELLDEAANEATL